MYAEVFRDCIVNRIDSGMDSSACNDDGFEVFRVIQNSYLDNQDTLRSNYIKLGDLHKEIVVKLWLSSILNGEINGNYAGWGYLARRFITCVSGLFA